MNTKTTEELKVMAYDKGLLVLQLQEQLAAINKEIARRSTTEDKKDEHVSK